VLRRILLLKSSYVRQRHTGAFACRISYQLTYGSELCQNY
jgi:hypothetical protein